jgi:hypothetical protein
MIAAIYAPKCTEQGKRNEDLRAGEKSTALKLPELVRARPGGYPSTPGGWLRWLIPVLGEAT